MKIILCIRSMIFSHLSVEGLANNTTEEGILVPMDLTFPIEFTLFSMSIGVIGIFSTPASIKQALVLLVPAFAAAKKWNLMKAVTETAAPSPPHCTLCPESMEYVQEKLCLGGILFPPPVCQQSCCLLGWRKVIYEWWVRNLWISSSSVWADTELSELCPELSKQIFSDRIWSPSGTTT